MSDISQRIDVTDVSEIIAELASPGAVELGPKSKAMLLYEIRRLQSIERRQYPMNRCTCVRNGYTGPGHMPGCPVKGSPR